MSWVCILLILFMTQRSNLRKEAAIEKWFTLMTGWKAIHMNEHDVASMSSSSNS